jgi:hypothetical protein
MNGTFDSRQRQRPDGDILQYVWAANGEASTAPTVLVPYGAPRSSPAPLW